MTVPEDYLEVFRLHCARLRELGATEVVVGELRAVFPPVRAVVPAPLATDEKPAPRKPAAPIPEADLRHYEGEKLTPEDVERRRKHAEIKAAVGA